MESDARVSRAWNADTCSGKTRGLSCAPRACRIHNSVSVEPEARYRRFENYLADRFPSLPQLFTRRARVAVLASNFSFHSAGFMFSLLLSLSSTHVVHTHTHTCTIEQRRYVSSASSFSSACEDKRTSSKTDRPLALLDTPRVIKRREETRELLCITRDAREPWFFFFFSLLLLPSRILKGSSGRNFFYDVNFFCGGEISFLCQNSRIIVTRNYIIETKVLLFEREACLLSLFRRIIRENFLRISLFVSRFDNRITGESEGK